MVEIECPSTGIKADNCDWIIRNGSVRDAEATGIFECTKCHLVTPSEDLSHLVNYEEGSMHHGGMGYGDTLIGPSEDIKRRVDSIKSLEREYRFQSILDFGCGSGEMLEALSGSYEVIGLEPDSVARELASRKVGPGSVCDSSSSIKLQGTQVDVITLFHVVEHLYSPSLELERIYRLLKPGGLIVIETPNSCEALLTKYENVSYQEFTYWSHHPMLHSHISLNLLLERNGFKVIQSEGVQRYDLSNHLYWMTKGMPGGHEIWKGMFSDETIQSYGNDLIESKTSDTLWFVAQKPIKP
jgi:SAM-dependent methyltransferase